MTDLNDLAVQSKAKATPKKTLAQTCHTIAHVYIEKQIKCRMVMETV
jgi:hypothetical protein